MKVSIATVSLFFSFSGKLASARLSLGCNKKVPHQWEHTQTNKQEENRKLQEALPYAILPDGIWTSRGYGTVFAKPGVTNVSDGTFSWIEETQVSCIVLEPVLTLEYLAVEEGMASALSENGTVLKVMTDPTDYLADRTDTHTGACAAGITPVPDDEGYVRDPAFTLAAMQQWFYEHYAFFDLRYAGGYDAWAQLAESFSLDADTTDEELLNVMEELVSPLDDAWVETDEAVVGVTKIPWFDQVSMEFKDSQASNSSSWADESEYLEAQVKVWLIDTLNAVYLDRLKGGLGATPLYGKVLNDDGVSCAAGYISFTDFAPNDQDLWESALAKAMTDLQDCPTLIVDVRINPGGCDCLALMVASYFASEPFHAFSKRAFVRNTDGTSTFTSPQDIVVEPVVTDLRYDGPVVVMASKSTAGAGEVLVLSLLPLPAVTVMGQPTFGSFSDNLEPDLPNGWLAIFSNEEYSSAADGEVYEGVGIPPDVTLTPESPLSLEDRQNNKDTWLEEAIKFATDPTAATTTETSMAPVINGVFSILLSMFLGVWAVVGN